MIAVLRSSFGNSIWSHAVEKFSTFGSNVYAGCSVRQRPSQVKVPAAGSAGSTITDDSRPFWTIASSRTTPSIGTA